MRYIERSPSGWPRTGTTWKFDPSRNRRRSRACTKTTYWFFWSACASASSRLSL